MRFWSYFYVNLLNINDKLLLLVLLLLLLSRDLSYVPQQFSLDRSYLLTTVYSF